MVQDARWFMRVPIRVDVCAVREEKIRHVEVFVDDGEGKRYIENLLQRGHVRARLRWHRPR